MTKHKAPKTCPGKLLSVLVAALHCRPWMRIVAELYRQAGQHDDVEVCLIVDGGALTSGTKRNMLTGMAQGKYIAFVDDDDEVAGNYIMQLRAACMEHDADVVTFDLEMLIPNMAPQTQSFGLGYGDKHRDGNTVHMTANHLCAWRRDVALRCRWPDHLGYGDDQLWYKPLVGFYRDQLSETHVDQVLYYYRFHPDNTANQQLDANHASKLRHAGGVDCFLDGQGNIMRAVAGNNIFFPGCDKLQVEDAAGNIRTIHHEQYQSITVKVV